MAGIAADFFMLATQGIVRIFIVVKAGFFPATRTVAVLAFFTVASAVLIVIVMTIGAQLARFLFIDIVVVMAVCAAHLAVFARQSIFGVFIVIKMGFFPVFGAMTILAFMPIVVVMIIIQAMAVITDGGDFFVLFARMAAVAGRLAMFPFEGEVSFVVIEARLGPALFVMAFLAFFPQPATVNVFFLMTAVAV